MLSSPFRRRHKWCRQRWSSWLYKGAQSVDAGETDRWCYWSTDCTTETRPFAYDWLLSCFWQNIKGFYTFKKFGFGPDFVKWVSVLMADAKDCVAYCSWLSKYFAVEAGTRQGCPFFTISLCSCGRSACNKNTTLWEHRRIKLLESTRWPLGKYHKHCTICRRFNVVFKIWAGYATGTLNFGWVFHIVRPGNKSDEIRGNVARQ